MPGTAEEGIGFQHCLKLPPRFLILLPDLAQVSQMSVDLALMPGQQNGLDVWEICTRSPCRYRPAVRSGTSSPRNAVRCYELRRGVQNRPRTASLGSVPGSGAP